MQETHHFPGIQRVKCPFSPTLHTCCNRLTSSCFSCRTSSASLCSTSSCCLRSATFLMCYRKIHRQMKGDIISLQYCPMSYHEPRSQNIACISYHQTEEKVRNSAQARVTQSKKILESVMATLFPLPPKSLKQPF